MPKTYKITRCVGSFYYAENKLQILVLFTSLTYAKKSNAKPFLILLHAYKRWTKIFYLSIYLYLYCTTPSRVLRAGARLCDVSRRVIKIKSSHRIIVNEGGIKR